MEKRVSQVKILGILCGLTGLWASSAQAEILEDDRSDIAGVIERYTTSWNGRHGEKFGVDFTEDADFVNIYGMHFKGRTEIEARHVAILTRFLSGSRLQIGVVTLREAQPGTIIAHVPWTIDGYREPSEGSTAVDARTAGVQRKGLFTQVFIRRDARWMITASHNVMEPSR